MRPGAPAVRIALLAGLLVAGCGGGGGGSGGTGGGSGRIAVVESVSPPDGSTEVDPAASIVLDFHAPMDAAMLLGGGFVVTPAGSMAPVSATITVSAAGMRATLDPDVPLAGNAPYQVRLSERVRTAFGREIGRPWFSEFRTGASGGGPPPPPPPGPGGTVRQAASLAVGRSGHAAAALQDGRVAVFGGFATSSEVTDSIEVYDPSAGTWTTAAAVLGLARARLTATVLVDGRVLLAGGETGSATEIGTDLWEIWDPAADAVVLSGSLAERRTRHRAVRLGDGTVILVGGSRTDAPGSPNFSRSSTEIFDPGVPGGAAGPAMAVPRAGHEAVLLSDGRVLVAGGHGTSALSEVFDPATGTFASAGTMVDPRRDLTATRLADGDVLAAGGGTSTAERWIASQGRWVQVTNVGDQKSLHTAVRTARGHVFLAGGEKPAAGGGTQYLSSTEFYDPADATFLYPGLRTTVPRSGHTATLLPGGDCLLVGGKSTSVPGPAVRTCDRVAFR